MTEQAPAAATEAAPEPTPAPAAVQPTAPEAVQQPQEPQRPEWLPSKFSSPEQLAKAYLELEKKLGQQGAPKPAAPAPAAVQPTAPNAAAPTPEETLQVVQAGFNLEALEDEYFEKGRLSDETYRKAESKGLSRAFLDGVLQGRIALVERQGRELMDVVGGPEEWSRIASWARANLTEKELRTFNEAVERGSMELTKMAIRGIQARYIAAVGRQPNLVGGDAAPSAEGYRSRDEAIRAMQDPRYRRDPAYRAEVESRLRASNPFSARTIA
jgi:hypothetical protein